MRQQGQCGERIFEFVPCIRLLKRQFEQPEIDFTRVRKRYDAFEKEFKEMIYQEEAIILPILQSIFSEDDWLAIANESEAFGYAIIEAPEEKWVA